MPTGDPNEGSIVRGRRGTGGRAPMLALGAVFVLLIAAETVREVADAEPGASAVSNLGYALAEALTDAYLVAAVSLVTGAMVYLLAYLRGVSTTVPEAIFNWAVVLVAAGATLLMYLE